jgi:hypothetical protein
VSANRHHRVIVTATGIEIEIGNGNGNGINETGTGTEIVVGQLPARPPLVPTSE